MLLKKKHLTLKTYVYIDKYTIKNRSFFVNVYIFIYIFMLTLSYVTFAEQRATERRKMRFQAQHPYKR